MKKLIQLTINRLKYEVAVEPRRTLAEMLRCDLGLTGTKIGCSIGDCGVCTVLLDGEPVFSCLVLAVEADGRDVLTIEGITDNRNRALGEIKQILSQNNGKLVAEGGVQWMFERKVKKEDPAKRPSKPSVRLVAFEAPTITKRKTIK